MVWNDVDPAYGHRRLAAQLHVNKKRIIRVMNKFGLRPPRRRVAAPEKPLDRNQPATTYPNLLWNGVTGTFIALTRPDQAWAQDFTYLWFLNRFWYVATVIDCYTREALGFAIADLHDTNLVRAALHDALRRSNRHPDILHADQGSEYIAATYQHDVLQRGIRLSYSAKGSPWQNGFQESFYANFKLDLGNVNRFATVGELVEGIALTIHRYNTTRIHTSLKMSPLQYYKNMLPIH